jgi:hypothetical protein
LFGVNVVIFVFIVKRGPAKRPKEIAREIRRKVSNPSNSAAWIRRFSSVVKEGKERLVNPDLRIRYVSYVTCLVLYPFLFIPYRGFIPVA